MRRGVGFARLTVPGCEFCLRDCVGVLVLRARVSGGVLVLRARVSGEN